MTPEEKQHMADSFHRFQKTREKVFAPVIFRALDSQVKQAIEQVKAGATNPTQNISSEGIVNALRPLYMDAATVYGARVRAYLIRQKARMPVGFNQRMIDLMTAYFQTDILNVSEGITDTTKALIQKVLQQAVELGRGIDFIVKELENTEVSRTRARLIARTESSTAANQGALFAAKDSGLKLNKQWLATTDKRTRHDHSLVNGQVVGVDDYFTLQNGEVTMKIPGARVQKNGLDVPASEVVNCRCTVLFLTIRDKDGFLIRE